MSSYLQLNIIPDGLSLYPDFITLEKEQELINWLDNQPWSTELSRRTQHYGFSYNYKTGTLSPSTPIIGPLLDISNMIATFGFIKPVQCIANEYYRGQGIAPHIDHLSFGSTIVGLSLGDDTTMIFTHPDNSTTFNCFLPRRSLILITGPARYIWKHSIPKQSSYINNLGSKIFKSQTYRRISLTYREIS